VSVSQSITGEILLKFQSLRDEIVVMQDQIKALQENFNKLNTQMTKFYDLIDGVMGDFKKFDEEQTLLSGRVSDHTDRLEKIEEKVFGTA
jgi:predicted  nucleic acid-binding Zn-ribbon protein